MRLLITRPENDAPALTTKLQSLGHDVISMPVMEIYFDKNAEMPEINQQDGMAFTSVNGLRALLARNEPAYLDLAAYAVGPATADACRQAGFETVFEADGDVAALAEIIIENPPQGKTIHIAGRDLAGDLASALTAAKINVQRTVIYRAQARQEMPPHIISMLRSGDVDGVLIYSQRSGQLFLELAGAANILDKSKKLIAFCLSPKVAEVMSHAGVEKCLVADKPNETALLALL